MLGLLSLLPLASLGSSICQMDSGTPAPPPARNLWEPPPRTGCQMIGNGEVSVAESVNSLSLSRVF